VVCNQQMHLFLFFICVFKCISFSVWLVTYYDKYNLVFRHIITVIGRWMTSSMIDDLCSCLNCIISDCLLTLNSLTSLVELDNSILDEFIYEERRSQSVFCDASSLTRVRIAFRHIVYFYGGFIIIYA